MHLPAPESSVPGLDPGDPAPVRSARFPGAPALPHLLSFFVPHRSIMRRAVLPRAILVGAVLCGMCAFVDVASGPLHASETTPLEVELGWIETGETSLYYETAGSGEPVVLIHGGFMDAGMWDDQFPVLARSYRVIRYDLRGFGRSGAAPERPYVAEDDLLALLDRLDVESAHVVGLSLGGSLAIDFALSHPARVKTMVLAEPGLGGHEFSQQVRAEMEGMMAAIDRGDREAAVRSVLQGAALSSARDDPRAWPRLRDQVTRNVSLRSNPMKMLRPVAASRLDEVRAPTLILVSEHARPDALAITERLAAEIAGAKLERIADAGHMMNLEQPERFARAVLDFLDEN